MNLTPFEFPYPCDSRYQKPVAYFSMEFAIHQALKIYSGGLGFLAGSHLRSAYELKQHLVGIGIKWKYGYYDQIRKADQSMDVLFMEKMYSFLEDTGLKFQIQVNGHPVWVTAYYLAPETFQTAPLFLLSTDLPDNDYLAQTICHRLYDSDTAAKIAQYMLLGLGGAALLDHLGYPAERYHLNEAHGLPAAFYLHQKFRDPQLLRQRLVFTTHTPEEAGNEKHDIRLLDRLGYFAGMSLDQVRQFTGIHGNEFNLSLATLRLASKANGVSRMHAEVSREMWGSFDGICPIHSITNAQNWTYWADKDLYRAMEKKDAAWFRDRKHYLKRRCFELVADQTGKLLNPEVFTLVWSRRFAEYKRADLMLKDQQGLEKLLGSVKYPVQVIWSGKPYPMDYGAISTFNNLVHFSKHYPQVAVLVGYELTLSKRLKQGADVWLNTPRIFREASGTSGMTAAMNGTVNFSTQDGWIPECIRHGENGFLIPKPEDYQHMPWYDQDSWDLRQLYQVLEGQILPLYYDQPDRWLEIQQQGMRDVQSGFDSNRMAREYYEILYV